MITHNGIIIAKEIIPADTFWTRFKGLMLTQELREGQAMVLVPCNGIHTWFMRYSIDVILCDRAGIILRSVPNVPPWRFGPYSQKAHFAIELPTKSIEMYGLKVGDSLEVGVRKRG